MTDNRSDHQGQRSRSQAHIVCTSPLCLFLIRKTKCCTCVIRGGRGHTMSAEPGGHTSCYYGYLLLSIGLLLLVTYWCKSSAMILSVSCCAERNQSPCVVLRRLERWNSSSRTRSRWTSSRCRRRCSWRAGTSTSTLRRRTSRTGSSCSEWRLLLAWNTKTQSSWTHNTLTRSRWLTDEHCCVLDQRL